MRADVARPGRLVTAQGVVVRVPGGQALVPADHLGDGDLARTWSPDAEFLVVLTGDVGTARGEHVVVTGRWTGTAIAVRDVRPASAPVEPTRPARPARRPAPRPAHAPAPPDDLELRLLADGTLTDRYPWGDGTLHVVADDVQQAERLLTPRYGASLRISRAVFSRRQRQAAALAMRVADSVAPVCAVGTALLDEEDPAESVHTLEVAWVTRGLADALTAVPEGLIRLTSHVMLVDGDVPDGR